MEHGQHKLRRLLMCCVLVSLLWHAGGGWFVATQIGALGSVNDWEDLPAVQIVDLVETANNIRPESARLVGSTNNSTTEETVSNRPRNTQPAQTQRTTPTPSREHLADNTDFRFPPATAIVETVGRGFSHSVPEDYFQNFKRGAHTYVNVLKHPSVDYFVELKRSLKIAWNPGKPVRAAIRHPAVRKGQLGVVIGAAVNMQGELEELYVLKGSGLPEYDQEALRAFRATYPTFPPAPATMQQFGKHGMLRMSWALIVNIT